jgi:hypothetical protein
MEPSENSATIVAAATWTGRHQAFAMTATKSTLAQAECLRQLRDTKAYAVYGVTWDEFCKQHAGMSRAAGDRLIQRLKEFGETYFRLSDLIKISEPIYRKLAPKIHDESVEIGGVKLALIPENAAKIRAAIQAVREELRDVQIENAFNRASFRDLQCRLEETLHEFTRRAHFPLPEDQREGLRNLLRHMIYRMELAAKEFDKPPKA